MNTAILHPPLWATPHGQQDNNKERLVPAGFSSTHGSGQLVVGDIIFGHISFAHTGLVLPQDPKEKSLEMEDVSQTATTCLLYWPVWPCLLPACSVSDLHRGVGEALLPLID